MFSSKTIKLTKILLFSIVLILLPTKLRQYWTHPQLTPEQKFPCSFKHISACQMSNRTFLYIIWGRAGFCSELNQILLAFAYSVATKRRLIIDSHQWNYGIFTDYFYLPSTNYYPQSNRTFIDKDNRQNDRINHLKTTRIGTQVNKFWLATRQIQSIETKRQVAHYLWKSLSNETIKFIETCRITNLSNYIGIHIRKGDKVKGEARGISSMKYINSIERILNKTKQIQQIFVTSDDQSAINKLRQLKPTWNFVNINHQRMNITGNFQADFNRLSRKTKVYETRLFMCELQMLIDAQYVLCRMSSNVCRLVQILRHQHPSTIISLDRSWYAT
jgi:hypothetical protein